MLGKISAKQKEILEYIKGEILSKGYPPAVREICEAVDLKSTSSVHSHLKRWRRMVISGETRPSQEQSRFLMTILTLPDVRL